VARAILFRARTASEEKPAGAKEFGALAHRK
jgi:hypothetical protein